MPDLSPLIGQVELSTRGVFDYIKNFFITFRVHFMAIRKTITAHTVSTEH